MGDPSLVEPRGAAADPSLRLARAGRGLRWLAWLLLPGQFVHYARGNVEINDFSVYYTAARAALDGVDPYSIRGPSGRPFVYPPGFAVLIAPLALLPFAAAAVLWTALSFAAVFASLALCVRVLGVPPGGAAWTIGGLALVCSGRMLDSELGNGQANHWVLLGIAACSWAVATGRPVLGGVLLSLAIVAKATPLLLAAYFAAKREWRVCAGVALGIATFAALLPSLALGSRGALAANLAWVRGVAAPAAQSALRSVEPPDEFAARVHGVSLRAFVHRHLTRIDAASHHHQPVFVNAVAWSPRAAERVYLGLAGLALAGAAFAVGVRRPRDPPRLLLEVAIVAATMVLIAPLSRKAHISVLLLPFVVGVASALLARERSAVLWVAPAALVFLVTSPSAIGRTASVHALAWGAYTLAALWLWAGALRAGWRDAHPIRDARLG